MASNFFSKTYCEPAPTSVTEEQDTHGGQWSLTQESNAPIVQIGDNQASMNAHPVGQPVIFSTVAKMKLPSFRFAAAPMGSAMIVAKMRARFYTETWVSYLRAPRESGVVRLHTMNTANDCSLPMIFESVEARMPWVMTHTMKTTYVRPLEGVQFPSLAMTMLRAGSDRGMSCHGAVLSCDLHAQEHESETCTKSVSHL
jgi:hypothetical protein